MNAPDCAAAAPSAIPLIHNPAARSERSARLRRSLEKLLPTPRLLSTTGPGHAATLAEACARQNEPVVAVAGGDGTLNEVIAGFLAAARDGYPLPELGILPTGTMNVHAMELGLSVGPGLRHCWETVATGASRTIDIWLANGCPLLQLGGVGLDASVVAETPWEWKRRIGPLGYVINTARILTRPAPVLHVQVDDAAVDGALVLLGNGKRYGGPLKLFPRADPGDGLLDVLVLRRQSAGDILGFLAALATGTLESFHGVWLGQGKSIRIQSARPVPMELDGEYVGTTPVEIHHSGHTLRVRVPPPS